MAQSILLFIAAAVIIFFIGPKLSRAADELGRRTKLGETLAGALFIGATTSLPGLIVSFKTALEGQAVLSVSNSIGGVAAQTLFIGIADAALRKGHLTHENTLVQSLIQSALLIALLTLILLAMTMEEYSIFNIHPISPILFFTIIMGFRIVRTMQKEPKWKAQQVSALAKDKSRKEKTGFDEKSKSSVIIKYIVYALAIGGAGWLISTTGSSIVKETSISPLIMGATFMAIASSLPELVTATSSVRRGSVGLAIGNIVGGNAFDTIMVVLADIAYMEGSIFNALGGHVTFLTTTTLLMTTVLLIGLIRREKRGLANIGIESYLIMIIYAGSLLMIFFGK